MEEQRLEFLTQKVHRYLRLSHRPRRIENAQLDSSFLWTMVIVLAIWIILVTWWVILKIISHRREIRRKLREYGIVLGDTSMSVKQEERKYHPSNQRPQRRIRIRSAQPRRLDANNRHSSNSRRQRSRNGSRNERFSNLPNFEERAPMELAPLSRNRNAKKRTGSAHSRNSNRSRRSARPENAVRLEPIPSHFLRHNNYLI